MRILYSLIAAMVLVSTAANADTLDRKERVEVLSQSTAQVKVSGDVICTASKIGSNMFLSARHCVSSSWPDYKSIRVVFEKTGETVNTDDSSYTPIEYADVTSLHMGGKGDDWAVFYTNKDIESMKPLNMNCETNLVVGDSIATMGYPHPMNKMYTEGYVSSVQKPNLSQDLSSEFWADLNVAPGSSGGPIINYDGDLIGILVGGIVPGNSGLLASGVQSVQVDQLCKIFKLNNEVD